MILIDTREQHKDYITERFKEFNTPSSQTCLSHGMDYLIIGNSCSVGVQRKSGSSEIPSQMEALRSDILPSLKDLAENPVLLIEEDFVIGQDGTMYQRRDGMLYPLGMNVKSYFNFINSVKLTGVDVVTTRNLDSSIWWFISLHEYLKEQHYPKIKKQHSPEMQAVGCLSAIGGFGIATSKKILSKYTLSDLFKADDTALSTCMTSTQLENFKKVKGATTHDDKKDIQ